MPDSKEYKLLIITDKIPHKHSEQILSLKAARPKLIVVLAYSEGTAHESIQWLKKLPVIDHLVPMKSENTKAWLEKLLSADGAEQIRKNPEQLFMPALTPQASYNLSHVDECRKCYDDVREYAESLKCFSLFPDLMHTAASELLTNAFYNGKRDSETGQAVTSDRRVKFMLAESEKITFAFGQSGNFLWMRVQDNFGTLDRQTLINAMYRAASQRTANISSPGGAGLGLLMLYDWSTEMNFSLVNGKSTTVCCKFKISKRQREFEGEQSAVHLFTD